MLEGKKTYITGIFAILYAVGYAGYSYTTGDTINTDFVIQMLTIAFSAIFIRSGVTHEKTKN